MSGASCEDSTAGNRSTTEADSISEDIAALVVTVREQEIEVDAFAGEGADVLTLVLTNLVPGQKDASFGVVDVDAEHSWSEVEQLLGGDVTLDELPDWVRVTLAQGSIDLGGPDNRNRGIVIVVGTEKTVVPVASIELFEPVGTTVSTLFLRQYAPNDG
jgi:hypothetical protein